MRLTFEEIAAKYNLPDDEIMRRRILAKLKLRVKSLARSGLALNTEHSMIQQAGLEAVGSSRKIHGYVLAGNARDKQKLRAKARCAHIVYGFFKRKPYVVIENSCRTPPDWGRVKALILAQDSAEGGVVLQQLAEWMSHVPATARRMAPSQAH